MAAVLTDELTRVSVANIEKWDESDGTVYVYGRCTTPEVDTDEQVVDSGWSGPALKTYLDEAPTVRVQHNAQRDPAGSAVRVDVNRDGDGAHWLKAAVDEPVAQRLVKKGHLRAFSVGIARPVIERDMSGKARGGIIKGGKIVEVSLVDSPANRSCFLEIAKSAADGTCEFTGKVGGSEDFLAKALSGDVLTKDAAPVVEKGAADTWTAAQAPDPGTVDISRFEMPQDLSVSFTPNDMMRLMQQKFVSQHYDELALKAVAEAEAGVYKRDIDTATRRRLAADGHALPNLSYPIENSGDLDNAATLARSGHGDVAAARRLIARRARELGVANPLDESDAKKADTAEELVAEKADVPAEPEALKEAEPDVTKDPEPEPEPEAKPKPVKKAKKPKKMPPWLKDGDSDSKDSDDGKDDDSSCKSATDHLWTGVEGTSDIVCSKCRTTPAQAAGVAGVHDMTCAPVPELMESDGPASVKGATPASASGAAAESMTPVPAHREPDGAPMEAFEKDAKISDGDNEKPTGLEAAAGMKFAADLAPDPEVAALLRFKMTGTDEDMGRLHDLTCPAYHPEQVAKYHPYADLGTLIDSRAWQRRTLAAAAGPLEASLKAQEVWQAALLLKTADPADLNQWRLELHKAFRDANPGPGSFPTPGHVGPQRYNRPVLTDGRAANGTGYDGPNSSPQVATSAPDAHSFDRPPLDAGHQSPSPSFMKASFDYPAEQGVPTQLPYAAMQKEQQRQALVRMHHHLSRQFPEMCPITLDATPVQQENHPVPVPAGIGKGGGGADDTAPVVISGPVVSKTVGDAPEAAFKATPEDGDLFADAEVYKGFKKMRKKLGKKVLSGSMTVDEARAKLGRQFAQKGAGEEPAQKPTAPPLVVPADEFAVIKAVAPPVAAMDPEVIKAAFAEALSPLTAELTSTKALLAEQQEAFTTKLAEQQRVIDAIADQPDPSTAAFSGLGFQPAIQKARRPAAVIDQAQAAARSADMIRRNLTHTYQTHSDPHVREAASTALANLGVGMEAPPMT